MIGKYICKNCGEPREIDYDMENISKECICNTPILPENDAGNAMAHLSENLDTAKETFEKLLDDYGKTGKNNQICTHIAGYAMYISRGGHRIPDFDNVWKKFILDATGKAVDKKDDKLIDLLKSHAIEIDKNENLKIDLHKSMLNTYPEILESNEWISIVEKMKADENDFNTFNISICPSLVKYIVRKKDKAFAIKIFEILKSEKKWKKMMESYINKLFSDNDVAENVFPPDGFDRETARFAREVKDCCGGDHSFYAFPVWKNYKKKLEMLKAARIAEREKQIKKLKKAVRNISIAVVILAVIVVAATFITLNSIDRSTIEFNVDKVIEITYGDSIYMGDYTVTYNKISGDEVTRGLTEKNLEGFDPETVGKKQTAYFKFKGRTEAVTVIVNPLELASPVITRDGNYVFWDAVAGAGSYVVYVNSDAVLTVRSEPFSYDLTSFEGNGAMTVSVRAKSSSEKYLDSPMSASVDTFKLATPSNIKYFDGKLTWDAVAGASSYEITVNGTPYTVYSPECDVKFSKGNNDVTINVKSKNETDILSTAHETIYNLRLDTIRSMTYSDGVVTWYTDDPYADIFSIYVDGEYWRDLSRNRLLLEADGFISEFGRTDHTIGIVSKSSASGTEPSEMKSYTITFGRPISMNGETLKWADIGTGASYFVTVNGEEHTLRESYLVFSEYKWQTGSNTVTVTARLGDTEYICGTVSLEKLSAPTVSLTPSGWSVTGTGTHLYSVNGGVWSETLPDVTALTAGDYTVRVKRIPSSGDSFEISSDINEIKINKAPTVFISVSAGELIGQFDSNKYYLKLYYAPHGTQIWSEISSLGGIRMSGDYDIRAMLCAKQEAFEGYTGLITSEYSNTVTVHKPSAPNVIYDSEAGLIYSDVPGAKFYYTDENGEECEIPGGRVSNMPGGVFRVYARLDAAGANTIDSESTPESGRVPVFNMNITLSISKKNETQCYVNFGGCSDISSITYSYKIIYYGADGGILGELDKSSSVKTAKKSSFYDNDKIIDQINYSWDGIVDEGAEVKTIELVIYIDSGDGELFHRSATMEV